MADETTHDFQPSHDWIDSIMENGSAIEYNEDGSVKNTIKISDLKKTIKPQKSSKYVMNSSNAHFINDMMKDAHKI